MSPEDLERRKQPVTVDQGYVEDSTRSFKLLVAFRDALLKKVAEGKLTDSERGIADQVIKALDELIAIKDKTIAAYAQMVKLQQDFIVFMNDFYTKALKNMAEAMGKKRGFMAQLWQGIKKTFQFILTILAGAGLAAVADLLDGQPVSILDDSGV